MTGKPTGGSMPPIRIAALVLGVAGTLFFLYTIYVILMAPPGDNTGFQLVGLVPLGLIFLGLTVPALVFAWQGTDLKVALTLGLLGFAAAQWLWWGALVNELHLG